MKKLFLISFVFVYSFTHAQSGYLSFYSQDGDKFWVVIDGKKINKEPQYNVDKFPVEMKWGKAKIIFEDTKKGTIDKTYQVVDVDGNSCYVKYMIRKNKKGKYEIRDIDATWEVINNSGASSVSQQTQQTQQTQQPSTQQSGTQTHTVQQTTTVTDPATNANINMGVGVNVTETQDGVNMNISMPGVQTSTQTSGVSTQVTTTTTTNQTIQQGQTTIKPKPQPVPQQEVKPAGGCVNPMSDVDFQSAKKTISSKSFEDSKLTLAKQIVSANCVLSSQVKEILDVFGFESTRLEFAKFAYKYTYDKKNYYKVNEGFKFESSIDELNEFINSGN
ncbi:MAG TPA: DUF4476 domain-containing protein [Bacteroidales bacterium]|nr:DUF4476 domain-containing protein [Bacteroidales bacterium]